MGLDAYMAKRQFDQTPEPVGTEAATTGMPRFVVQKHDASQLHYDFRLEAAGVLKSWAVPKGPSANPHDKRLAMMTEDHPLDYRHFEGIIPTGQYGAGPVMIWDEGQYLMLAAKDRISSEQAFADGLAKGHLTFVLSGSKLAGEYALIKMEDADPNAWLLVKKDDGYASDQDITSQDKSVRTGRTIEQIAAGTAPTDAPAATMPHHLRPMLATLGQAPFDDANWLFEVKWDGYRALAEVDHGQVELYSRNLQPYNDKFVPVAQALQAIGHQAVLDGEVVVLDSEGISRFQLLQDWRPGSPGQLVYYLFDLLYLDGRDLRSLPLVERKRLLANVIPATDCFLRLSEHISGQGQAFFQAAADQGLEGIVAKRADSRYQVGKRSADWLKLRTTKRQEVVIGGYTEPRGSRRGVGSLLLGVYEGHKLRFAGHSGGSFAGLSPEAVLSKLEPLKTATCPFTTPPETNGRPHWVKPQLVVEVAFTEWTADGSMRHPQVVGWRDDKPAAEVRREVPAHAEPPVSSPSQTGETTVIGGQRLKLTNLSKVYWPEEGYTKGDLINYYRSIASTILPYLRGRPQSLNRFPHGIAGESFYQKDVDIAPEWVEHLPVFSESNQATIDYVVCRDEATLAWLANLGCIEMNVWNSTVDNLDNPTYLVIDLDPEDISFDAVVEAALVTREVLAQADITGYCKTSGATGLHIYVPLGARYSYDQVRQFAQLIATLVHHRLPKTTSLERSPAKRQGRVYLDYLQNRRGQTMAAPYCVRPKPGATVSTPLAWSEVTTSLRPSQFNIHSIHQRLKYDAELWRPVLGQGIDLAKSLENLPQ